MLKRRVDNSPHGMYFGGMRRLLLAAGAAILLAGCQGTPIGDAMIGDEKLAAMDDEYCQSIGAKPGSDAYVQCRMFKTGERQEGHRQAYRRAAGGLAATGASMQRRPVNCTSAPIGSSVSTTCY